MARQNTSLHVLPSEASKKGQVESTNTRNSSQKEGLKSQVMSGVHMGYSQNYTRFDCIRTLVQIMALLSFC